MLNAETNSRIARILYRGLLRWAGAHDNCPIQIQRSHVSQLVPFLVSCDGSKGWEISLNGGTGEFQIEKEDASVTVRHLARLGFQHGQKTMDLQVAYDQVDRGIDALRLLNTRYHDSVESIKALREEHARIMSSNKVKYSIGQVFIHRKYGYKGIIYGFDSTCQRDDEWMNQMQITNRYQPFYYALPDEEDARRLLGGIRLTKYVAEENIDITTDKRVVHRALENYFIGYSTACQRYVPTKRLRFEYPDTAYPDMLKDMEHLDGSESNVMAWQDE